MKTTKEKERKEIIMNIQEAENEILKEQGKPRNSRDIESIGLEKGRVSSEAEETGKEHEQTSDKKRRVEGYNNPQ